MIRFPYISGSVRELLRYIGSRNKNIHCSNFNYYIKIDFFHEKKQVRNTIAAMRHRISVTEKKERKCIIYVYECRKVMRRQSLERLSEDRLLAHPAHLLHVFLRPAKE